MTDDVKNAVTTVVSDDNNVSEETVPVPAIDWKGRLKPVLDGIELNPFLEHYIGNNFFLPDESVFDSFEFLLKTLINEMDAKSLSEQMICFQRAKRMFDELYYGVLKVRIVDLEKRPAVEAVLLRAVASEGVTGQEAVVKARELADDVHVMECEFNVTEWEEAGWGKNIVEAEAHRRAFPALTQLDRLVASNQRAQAATLKEWALLKRVKKA